MNNISFQLNIERSQEQPESQFSETQMVIYQKRVFELNRMPKQLFPDLFCIDKVFMAYPNKTFIDKIFTAFAYILELEVDSGNICNELPPVFRRIIGQVNQIFQQIQASSSEDQMIRLRDLSREALYRVESERRQQLLLAGVSSGKELEMKQKEIASYQLSAEKFYLQNSKHVEIRKEIDLRMLLAYKGSLTEQEKKIIHQYWNQVATTSDGDVKRTKVQARSMQFILDLTVGKMGEFFESIILAAQQEEKKFEMGRFILDYWEKIPQKIAKKLMEERQICKDSQEQLMLDYLLLTGEVQMAFVLKKIKREMLMKHLEEVQVNIEKMTDFYREMNESDVKWYEKQTLEQKESVEAARKKLETLRLKGSEEWRIEHEEAMLKIEEEGLECMKENYEKIKAYTEKDFAQQALKSVNERPEEIEIFIPPLTHFDQIMFQLMDIETGGQAAKILETKHSLVNSLNPDEQLDFDSLKDPVEYFIKKIENQDLKKLELLKLRVEEV